MSGAPPSDSSEGVYLGSEPGKPRPSLARRRDKPQLSCNHCRRKKLRCDRLQPCHNCAGRGLPCVYVTNAGVAASSSAAGESMLSLQDRLVHLERLVKTLMPDSANQPKPRPPDPSPASTSLPNTDVQSSRTYDVAQVDSSADGRSECGSINATATELPYIGDDHWAAILESISDLKHHIDREEEIKMAGGAEENRFLRRRQSPHALLLYGCPRAGSREEILSALPPKAAVDRYVSFYFNHLALAYSVLHAPSFLREYQTFWETSGEVPIAWVGLLFSIICLSAIASKDHNDVGNKNESEQSSLQIELYRERIVQCLVLAEYTKTGPHVLEAIIHYAHIEFAVHPDANNDLWYLFSIVAHMAMRMGYHRDPSHFSGITPLKAEMRRRIWSSLLLGNILISSQVGMPRIISSGLYDTAEPRNLTDAELDAIQGGVDSQLPPSRPETEYTPVLGVIGMRRITEALGTISDLRAAVKVPKYDEVMRIDDVLHQAAASVPLPMKMTPMAASVTDPPNVIMWRLFIGHLFYKGQILLHQPYLFPSAGEGVHAYSQKACLDAALGMLEIQRILDEETQPGGQISMMRWRVSSVMNNQFLTATMVLCSMLHRGVALGREEEIRSELRRTRTIWIRASRNSREAERAAEAVNFVLSKTGNDEGFDADRQGRLLDPFLLETINHGGFGFGDQTLSAEHMELFDSEAVHMQSLLGEPSATNEMRSDDNSPFQNDPLDRYPQNAWTSMP